MSCANDVSGVLIGFSGDVALKRKNSEDCGEATMIARFQVPVDIACIQVPVDVAGSTAKNERTSDNVF